MRLLRAGAVVLSLLAACSGCISSDLVLHVRADYSGQATITSRVFLSSMAAADSLFAGTAPAKPPTVEELLPAPSQGALDRAFGTEVSLGSSAIDKATDGGIRTTVVDFDDVRKVRLVFPPAFAVLGGSMFSLSSMGDAPVVTFSVKPHENGDELLLVKMPEPAVHGDPNGPVTTFESGSPEEQAFKRAIKGLALKFTVETEQPILRTNAPKMTGAGATILDLDLDKMINAMDEAMSRRLLVANSFQEILWQMGDLPGASIPVDHEVFIEYQPAQRPKPAPAPAAAPAQAPPDTEIYLAPLKIAGGTLSVGTPENITKNAGYDNQPFFTPQGSILYTSMRNGAAETDIYRYDIASGRTLQVIGTPESEYSPTVTPLGALSVVRVELDGHNTQRLWQFTADGREPRVLLPDVKPVGYHAWADDRTLVLFILGANRAPATLQIADTGTGATRIVATDVGRSIQRIPGGSGAAHISFVQRERNGDSASWLVKELDPATGTIAPLAPAIDRDAADLDTAWTPDGTLLAARGGTLYAWRRGDSGWKEVASLERLGLHGVTRLAVSPKGDWLALVGNP